MTKTRKYHHQLIKKNPTQGRPISFRNQCPGLRRRIGNVLGRTAARSYITQGMLSTVTHAFSAGNTEILHYSPNDHPNTLKTYMSKVPPTHPPLELIPSILAKQKTKQKR